MGRAVYSAEHLTYLRQGYPVMSVEDLTRGFNQQFGLNRTPQQIKSTLKNHKIKSGRKAGELNRGKNYVLTREQDAFFRKKYQEVTLIFATEALNAEFCLSLTVEKMKSYASRRKCLSGRTGCFENGSRPWNSGTRGVMKPNSGNFKKGDIPRNRKPLGHERIDTKDGYVWIKVAERNPYTDAKTRYKLKHHVIWEQHHGSIPEGMVVSFIDGDKLNCALENLELLTMAENCYLNKYRLRSVPDEMRDTVRVIAKLATRAGKLQREVA